MVDTEQRQYQEADLHIPDAMAWVRRDPSRFFPADQPMHIHLISGMMMDVLFLGGRDCAVRQIDDWWIVGSALDWLKHSQHTAAELFAHVVSDPRQGVHSMRSEILVAAFARRVWMTLDGHLTRISGSDEPGAAVLAGAATFHRAVLFSM